MAKVLKSDKGFKLIEMSATEVIDFGGMGICDSCGNAARKGVYVAVLNSWMCDICFKEWHARAVNYASDREVEKANFEAYKRILRACGHEVAED